MVDICFFEKETYWTFYSHNIQYQQTFLTYTQSKEPSCIITHHHHHTFFAYLLEPNPPRRRRKFKNYVVLREESISFQLAVKKIIASHSLFAHFFFGTSTNTPTGSLFLTVSYSNSTILRRVIWLVLFIVIGL